MKPRLKRVGMTSKSLFYAIVVHVIAGVILAVNLEWPSKMLQSRVSESAPVQANVVSEAEIQRQQEAIRKEEEAGKRRQEEARRELEELLEKKKQEEQRLAEIRQRQEEEKRKAEELERQKERERQELAKLEQEEEARRQAEAERKRQEEAERKRREEAERQRQAEAERQRKEEEARRQAEAERRAEEERRRREAEERRKEEQRQRELAEERERKRQLQEQLERERIARQVNSALARYTPIIRQKVSRNWNRPTNVPSKIEAHVRVRLSQTGEVLSARITKSSGNPVFDRSVRAAVLKASPLPIPREQGINEEFRTLDLTFKPEDMIS